jgi:hypothetical protein
MKIKDIIANVKKDKDFQDKIFIGDFAEKFFDLNYIQNWDDQDNLTAYYFANWHCTDKTVGYKVYFYEGEPVAVSEQTGRKSSEEIEWISKEAFKKVKDYIMSFAEEFEPPITLVNLEQECGYDYFVQFYTQMYDYHKNNALYNGDTVKITGYKDSFNDGKYHPEIVEIEFQDGSKIWVETKELRFKFNVV